MVSSETASGNLILSDLVRAVKSAIATESDAEDLPVSVGHALRPFLQHPGLVEPEQKEPDPDRYRAHVLHVEEDGSFSIVAMVWMPGQSTSIHDHVSWCVTGVAQGYLRELQYRLVEEPGDHYLLPIGETINKPGSIAALNPPGDVHSVSNPGPWVAISIHVYGMDVRELGTSIRRAYELPIVEFLPVSLRYSA